MRIEELITERILVGDFEPGQLLKEEALAVEFSVSRTPIRQVLTSLVAKGYADYERQRGVTAPKMELHTVGKLLEAMELMIPSTVPLGAARIRAEQTEKLGNLLVNIQEASIDADNRKFAVAYWSWVNVLIDAVQNEFIARGARQRSFHMHRIRTIAMKRWPKERVGDYVNSIVNYASELVSAYAAHDVEECQRLVLESFRDLRRRLASTHLGVGLSEVDENFSSGVVTPRKAS